MGGSWERLIRTVKQNLRIVAAHKRLSDEVLRNLFAEVENTVNSLLLTNVPIDDDSSPALTPNDFLLGSSSGAKPMSTQDGTGVALKQNWKTSQMLVNLFWKRWLADYLPEITRRTKWCQQVREVEVDDVVVVTDPDLPRDQWPKGRVIRTHRSGDGKTRSVVVRVGHREYDRPVARLAVLDVSAGDSEH